MYIRRYFLSLPPADNSHDSILQKRLFLLDHFLITYIFPFGFIVQLTGILWIGRGSSWIAQSTFWLLLPAFISFLINIKKLKTWRPEWTEIFLVMFLMWTSVSQRWSETTLTWLEVAKRCVYIGLYIYAIICLGRSPEKLKKYLVFSCVLAIIAALISIINHYGIEGEGLFYRQYRIYNMGIKKLADFGIPPWAAIYYAIFFVLLFSWQHNTYVKKGYKAFLVGLGLFVLGAYLILTWSRGAWVGTIGGVVFSFLINRSKHSLMILLSVLSVGAIAALVYYFSHIDVIYQASNEKILDPTFDGRTNIWKEGFELILQRPWLGHGFDAKVGVYNNWGIKVNYIHNYFVQLVYFYGFIGLSFFVGMLTALGTLIFRYRQNTVVRIGAAILITALICMLNDIHKIVTRPGESWLYIWLPVGMILSAYYQQNNSIKKQS